MSRHLLRDRARKHGLKWLRPHDPGDPEMVRFRLENSWLAGYDAAIRDERQKQRSRGNLAPDRGPHPSDCICAKCLP